MNIIGVDIGGTKISAGIVRNRKIVKIATRKIYAKHSKNEVIEQIIKLIAQLFNSDTKAIGIGVPAIMDIRKGVIYESVNIPSLDNVPLKRILEKKFNVPVIMNNDANCFALGEMYFGAGKNYKDIVGLIIGTGVGAGIIIDNKLYCGRNCGAGEFGKIPYLKRNIEYYCSGKFFKGEYGTKGEILFRKAMGGNAKAKKIFNTYGRHIGNALSVIINSLDPQIIILGGSVSKSYKFFIDSTKKSFKEFIYKKTFKNIIIKVSRIQNIAILGAASLCFDKMSEIFH